MSVPHSTDQPGVGLSNEHTTMNTMKCIVVVATILSPLTAGALAFLPSSSTTKSAALSSTALQARISRRQVLKDTIGATSAAVLVTTYTANPSPANAAAAVQDSLEIEEFLRTGVDGGKICMMI